MYLLCIHLLCIHLLCVQYAPIGADDQPPQIVVYRMPFSEDRQELGAEGEEDMHTLHLARLHYEGKKKAASGSH